MYFIASNSKYTNKYSRFALADEKKRYQHDNRICENRSSYVTLALQPRCSVLYSLFV